MSRAYGLIFLFFISTLWAQQTCYLNVVKSTCWQGFQVDIKVIDAVKNKLLTTITIPKDKIWARGKFECEPEQTLFYKSQFSPIFWQSDKGQWFSANNYWSLPKTVQKGMAAWVLTVCFPRDFSGVPFPPEASGNCKCQIDKVPAIKLKPSA